MVSNKCKKKYYKKVKGFKGDVGDKGIVGDRGDVGPRGDIGPSGPRGDIGPSGDDGDRGRAGVKGDKGDKGARGPRGERGIAGERGPKGEMGDKGPKGDIGEVGPQGDIGPRGIPGPSGEKGDPGRQGAPGLFGDKGAIGDKGERGDTGPPGLNGVDGDRGPKGPQGDIGPQGEKGTDYLSPGEIIIKKICQYMLNENIECYVQLSTPDLEDIGIGSIDRANRIIRMQNSCIFFDNKKVIPINNIESISFSSSSEENRNLFLNIFSVIFRNIINCTKNAAMVVPLNDNNDPMLSNNIAFDYEYVLDGDCENDISEGVVFDSDGGKKIRKCNFIGKKIDICNFTGNYSEYFRRLLDKLKSQNKEISKISTSLTNFTDLSDLVGNIKIGSTCLGAAILTHNKTNERYITTIINLDKVSGIEIIN